MQTKSKKLLSKIILFSVLIGNISLSTTLADDFAYVKVIHLNVRSAGNHLAKIIATVDKGYKVTVLETLSNGWKKVILENGQEGYLNGKYITDEMPQYAKVDGSRYTIKSGMAFLRGFNMISKVAVLKKGDILEVTSDKLYLDKWIQVRVVESQLADRYIGRTGYIAKRLVEVVSGYEINNFQTDTQSSSTDSLNEILDQAPPFELNSAPADPDEEDSTDESGSEEDSEEDSTDESGSSEDIDIESTDSE